MPYADYVAANNTEVPVVDGTYEATVTSERDVLDPRTSVPLLNQRNKRMVDVVFDLGHSVTRSRRFSVSFGKMPDGEDAPFSEYLGAVSGLGANHPSLQMMDPGDNVGKRCQIVLKTVTKPDGKKYQNVSSVLPPETGGPTTGPRPVTRTVQPPPRLRPETNPDLAKAHEAADRIRQRTARPPRPEPPPVTPDDDITECIDCGAQLYEGDGIRCENCESGRPAPTEDEVPF